jgi:hypothetical protein
LAAVWLHSPAIGILRDWPSPGQYIDIQNENHSIEQMALAQSRPFVLTGREQPERLFGARTQSSLFEMLGAKPLLGRLLLPEEDKPGKPDVAVLSERVWKRLFNSDPAIIGKTIVLNGNPIIVAGVLQRGFMLDAEVMPSETAMDKMAINGGLQHCIGKEVSRFEQGKEDFIENIDDVCIHYDGGRVAANEFNRRDGRAWIAAP